MNAYDLQQYVLYAKSRHTEELAKAERARMIRDLRAGQKAGSSLAPIRTAASRLLVSLASRIRPAHTGAA